MKKSLLNKMTALFLAVMMTVSALPILASGAETDGYWKTLALVQMDNMEQDANNSAKFSGLSNGKKYTVTKLWGTNGKISGSSTVYGFTDYWDWYWPALEKGMAENKPATVGEKVMCLHGACHQHNSWHWTSSDTGWSFPALWDSSKVKAGDKIKVSLDIYMPKTYTGKKTETVIEPDPETGEDVEVTKVSYVEDSSLYKSGWEESKGCWQLFPLSEDEIPDTIEMVMTAGTQTKSYNVPFEQWETLEMEYELTEADIEKGTVSIRGITPSEGSIASVRWAVGAVKVDVLSTDTEVGDGSYWSTSVDFDMDGFTSLKDDGQTPETINVNGRDVTAEFVIGKNWAKNGNSKNYQINASWAPCYQEAYASRPATVGSYALAHWGAWDGNAFANTSSDSGWRLSNLWDENSVKAGDRGRVTIQFYADSDNFALQTMDTSKGKYAPYNYADSSSAIYNPNPRPTSGDIRLTIGSQEYYKPIVGDKWNQIVVEFDITDANASGNTLRVDSGAVGQDKFYAQRWLLGAVKVEICRAAGGSYTIDDGKEWQKLSTVTLDDFETTCVSGDGSNGKFANFSWGWYGSKTVGEEGSERTVHLNAFTVTPEAYKSMYATGGNASGLNPWTGLKEFDEAKSSGKPEAAGNTYFALDGRWSNKGAAGNTSNRMGNPGTSIMLSNIFDESEVEVGDTLRITAWVWPSTLDSISKKDISSVNKSTVSMWVSERADADGGAYEGDMLDYAKHKTSDAAEGEIVTTEVMTNKWNKIELVYTVNEDNMYTSSIQINNDNVNHNIDIFARTLDFAGVTVEKLVDKEDQSTVGAVKGSVGLGLNYVAEGTKILVVAYKDGVILGCDIIDYLVDGEYDFEIENATLGGEMADTVEAYVLSVDDAAPQLEKLELTKGN